MASDPRSLDNDEISLIVVGESESRWASPPPLSLVLGVSEFLGGGEDSAGSGWTLAHSKRPQSPG